MGCRFDRFASDSHVPYCLMSARKGTWCTGFIQVPSCSYRSDSFTFPRSSQSLSMFKTGQLYAALGQVCTVTGLLHAVPGAGAHHSCTQVSRASLTTERCPRRTWRKPVALPETGGARNACRERRALVEGCCGL